MFQLMYLTGKLRANDITKYGIFDSNDFSIEQHYKENIRGYLRSGVKIKGLSLKNEELIYSNIEKSLIFNDYYFAFLNSSVKDNDYQYNIEVIHKGAELPSFSFGYNIWIQRDIDVIQPEVVKLNDNVYEIRLYGREVGFSVVVVNMGNGIIKQIYRDKTYVSKNSKLYSNGLNFYR